MAGAFVSAVFDGVNDVTSGEKMTLLALADRANKAHGGEAWPSLRDIAERTLRQERQIRLDVRTLEAHGWIARVTSGIGGRAPGGRGKATIYQLNFAAMLYAMPAKKAAMHYRELRKIPGTLPPGFTLHAIANRGVNPAVHDSQPGNTASEPGSAAQGTRSPITPELEVNRNLEKEVEPEGARANPEPINTGSAPPLLKTVLEKLNTEPEKGNGQVPTASGEVSSHGQTKNRLGKKNPRAETEAEYNERFERSRAQALAAIAAKQGS